ncbi:hypothetical protein BCO_0900091 (plasmid) [Borrelia coriaceae ATCC 43381]|uniref:Uncharacterized protein n=1 Tax=Borrelia coriaceae ATCC 43381 TaxID=1408429 RepID=W5SX49_9SPIR|nr:hypothetical protein BCO_0900091 [Borrelia coriaceae ATCC 43381]
MQVKKEHLREVNLKKVIVIRKDKLKLLQKW